MTYAALAGVTIAIAVTAAALIAGALSVTAAVAVVLGVTCSAALAVTFTFVRRIDVRLDELTRQHTGSVRDGKRQHEALHAKMDKLDAGVGHSREWVSRDVFTGYRQLEAMVDLRGLIRPRAPLPPLRGWALSPDALRLITQEIFVRHPQLIVECGSGSSSVWFGYVVQQLGTGRVIALEHDERYAELSRDLLKAHGLEDVVEIRHAPLTPWDGGTGPQPWYDRSAIDDLEKIGLLLVDGPPGTLGKGARYPALPLLLPKCAENGLIVLDDVVRAQENAVSDRWLAEHPELRRTVYEDFEKGLHVFERISP